MNQRIYKAATNVLLDRWPFPDDESKRGYLDRLWLRVESWQGPRVGAFTAAIERLVADRFRGKSRPSVDDVLASVNASAGKSDEDLSAVDAALQRGKAAALLASVCDDLSCPVVERERPDGNGTYNYHDKADVGRVAPDADELARVAGVSVEEAQAHLERRIAQVVCQSCLAEGAYILAVCGDGRRAFCRCLGCGGTTTRTDWREHLGTAAVERWES